jgi:hypothetical protein
MKKEESNLHFQGNDRTIILMDSSEFKRYKTLLQKKEYSIYNLNFYLSNTPWVVAKCAVYIVVYRYIPISRVLLIAAIFFFNVENKKKSVWRTKKHLEKFGGLTCSFVRVIKENIPKGFWLGILCFLCYNHFMTGEWAGMSIISCLSYRCYHYTLPVYFILSRGYAFLGCLPDLKIII